VWGKSATFGNTTIEALSTFKDIFDDLFEGGVGFVA
jgi:hypothetical protein